MKHVVIYTTPYCPFCVRAKYLLEQKNVDYTEIDVSDSPAKREEMQKKTNRTSVPQIFIDDIAIGGCDELYALNESNKLDKLLFD